MVRSAGKRPPDSSGAAELKPADRHRAQRRTAARASRRAARPQGRIYPARGSARGAGKAGAGKGVAPPPPPPPPGVRTRARSECLSALGSRAAAFQAARDAPCTASAPTFRHGPAGLAGRARSAVSRPDRRATPGRLAGHEFGHPLTSCFRSAPPFISPKPPLPPPSLPPSLPVVSLVSHSASRLSSLAPPPVSRPSPRLPPPFLSPPSHPSAGAPRRREGQDRRYRRRGQGG